MKRYIATYFLLLFLIAAIGFTACTKQDKSYLDVTQNPAVFNGSTYDYLAAQSAGSYDSLLLLLDYFPDLKDSLKTETTTFFALTNHSFQLMVSDLNFYANLPEGTINLRNIDKLVLDTFLCRYIIRDAYLSTDLLRATDGYTLPSIKYDYEMNLQHIYTNASGFVNGGPRAIIFSDRKTSPFVSFWVSTNAITVDVRTDNGVVNVLTPGHSFGFGTEFREAVYRSFVNP
ncbi:MAG: hypothetical protein ACK5NK_09730 [Niabella sp.]